MTGKNLMHFLRFAFFLDKPNTQTTEAEQSLIRKYSSGCKNAVEIGVFEGFNTAIIAESLSSGGLVYGVDPFFKGRLGISYTKWTAMLHFRRHKVKRKIMLIEKFSANAIDDLPAEIDFIFIDGDHSFEGLAKDWELYAPRIKKGGCALLHDTTVPSFDPGRAHLGSVACYREIISNDPSFNLIDTADSLNVLIKTR